MSISDNSRVCQYDGDINKSLFEVGDLVEVRCKSAAHLNIAATRIVSKKFGPYRDILGNVREGWAYRTEHSIKFKNRRGREINLSPTTLTRINPPEFKAGSWQQLRNIWTPQDLKENV